MSSSNQSPLDSRPPAPSNFVLAKLIGFIVLALIVIGVAGAAWIQQMRKKQVVPPPPILGHVSAPTFIDENGTSFTISQLDGRMWVADFIFTRCGAQCPVMSINMQKLQTWLKENELGNVKLVSITVDPEHDTPEVLKRYSDTFKADENIWHFLTADRQTIYDYILNDFKLGVEENQGKPIEELFVHSDKFILIDRDRNIRGYYSGTDEADLAKLREAIFSVSQETGPPDTSNIATPTGKES